MSRIRKPVPSDSITQFEINLYEAVLKTNPNDITALIALGYIHTKTGKHEKALEHDKKLVSLQPEDPTHHYNLACSYSNLEMLDEALKELDLAICLGFNDFALIEKDPDLTNLRRDPRYKGLITDIKSRKKPTH